jgi:hypothetical protein
MHEDDRRTLWDVLTSVGRGAVVTFPDRPSQALVALGNGWAVSVTVSPGARCSSGMARMLSTGSVPADVLGRYGSPEGWLT